MNTYLSDRELTDAETRSLEASLAVWREQIIAEHGLDHYQKLMQRSDSDLSDEDLRDLDRQDEDAEMIAALYRKRYGQEMPDFEHLDLEQWLVAYDRLRTELLAWSHEQPEGEDENFQDRS